MTARHCLLFALVALAGAAGCGKNAPDPAATADGPAIPPAVLAPEPAPSFPAATAADVAKVAAEAARFGGQAQAPVRADVPAVYVQFAAGAPKEAEVPDLVRRLTATGVPVTVHVGSTPQLSSAALAQFLGMPNLLGLQTSGTNLLATVEGLDGAPRVEAVSVYGPENADVRPLVKLKRLRVLSVSARELAGLDRLAELPDLHSLSLGSAGLSPAVLAPVWRLTGLQELRLEGGTLSDADLAPLANMINLRTGFFGSAKVTANVYEHLAGLPELRTPVLGSKNFTDASLAHFGRLRSIGKIERLQLFGPEVTDAGLAHLAGMTGLKDLGLYGTPKVGAAGMAVLAGLPNLSELSIDTGVEARDDSGPKTVWIPPAAALDGLAGAKALKRLRLGNAGTEYLIPVAKIGTLEELELTLHTGHGPEAAARVPKAALTDVGLTHLRGATNLRKLNASGARVSDDGLGYLSEVKKLTDVRLVLTNGPSDPPVTDTGAAALAKLTGLEYLQLQGAPLTDAGVAKLAALPALKTLSLLDARLTDAAFGELAKFPALESVSVSGGRVTAAGMDRLRAAKKGIKINGQ